jgi:hypothetical protein
MSSTDDPELKQVLVGLDADARRRDLPALLGVRVTTAGPTEGPVTGTDAADPGDVPPLFTQVVRKLIDRRQLSQWQQSRGRFIRRHAGGPLDDEAKEQLRRLQQQLATRHTP